MGFDAGDKPAGDKAPWASWRIVTKEYFAAMGLTMVDGRTFTEQDIIGKPFRVVISQRLARQMWPGESAVGRTGILWKGQGDDKAEVVGVVSDMRERGLEMLVLDFIERRQLVRERAFGEKWLGRHVCFLFRRIGRRRGRRLSGATRCDQGDAEQEGAESGEAKET